MSTRTANIQRMKIVKNENERRLFGISESFPALFISTVASHNRAFYFYRKQKRTHYTNKMKEQVIYARFIIIWISVSLKNKCFPFSYKNRSPNGNYRNECVYAHGCVYESVWQEREKEKTRHNVVMTTVRVFGFSVNLWFRPWKDV